MSMLSRRYTPYRNPGKWIEGKLFNYVKKRHPPEKTQTLSQSRLYIFPSARGWNFILVCMTLWFLGTNYQNNLILGLSYLLSALFVVTILHTYANLSGLTISSSGASSNYSGSILYFKFKLSRRRRASENLHFRFRGAEEALSGITVNCKEDSLIEVPFTGEKRGWLSPGSLLVESEYPLGLLRCWTWLSWEEQALVYPKPVAVDEPEAITLDEDGPEEHPIKGGEDYSGLNAYQAGDPIKHIAWKNYARGQGLYTKEFSQTVSREIWLDFFSVSANGIEEKLSGLCYWVLEYEKTDENYGLRLPGKQISPAKGEGHKYEVLRALACFGLN